MHSPVDGHLGCFLETFLSHYWGRSDLASWNPKGRQRCLREKEERVLDVALQTPPPLQPSHTWCLYVLHFGFPMLFSLQKKCASITGERFENNLSLQASLHIQPSGDRLPSSVGQFFHVSFLSFLGASWSSWANWPTWSSRDSRPEGKSCLDKGGEDLARAATPGLPLLL